MSAIILVELLQSRTDHLHCWFVEKNVMRQASAAEVKTEGASPCTGALADRARPTNSPAVSSSPHQSPHPAAISGSPAIPGSPHPSIVNSPMVPTSQSVPSSPRPMSVGQQLITGSPHSSVVGGSPHPSVKSPGEYYGQFTPGWWFCRVSYISHQFPRLDYLTFFCSLGYDGKLFTAKLSRPTTHTSVSAAAVPPIFFAVCLTPWPARRDAQPDRIVTRRYTRTKACHSTYL